MIKRIKNLLQLKRFAFLMCFNVLLIGHAKAQNTFYIRPIVQNKIFMAGQVSPEDYNAAKRYPLTRQKMYNPYVYSESYQTMRALSYELGLAIGWISSDKSRMIEAVWQGDPAGNKTSTHSRQFLVPYYNILEPQSSRSVRQLAFNYSFKLKKNPSFMTTRFSLGTGVFINFNSNTDVVVKWNYDYWLEPNVKLKSIYFQPFAERIVKPFIAIGIESEFKINQKYIASLKLNIVQGLGVITRMEVVHEYEINGNNYLSEIGLISRGSGISLQLSRRFQFYPWKKKEVKE